MGFYMEQIPLYTRLNCQKYRNFLKSSHSFLSKTCITNTPEITGENNSTRPLRWLLLTNYLKHLIWRNGYLDIKQSSAST